MIGSGHERRRRRRPHPTYRLLQAITNASDLECNGTWHRQHDLDGPSHRLGRCTCARGLPILQEPVQPCGKDRSTGA